MSKYAVQDIIPAIEEEARKQGVDPNFARAILASENSGSGVLNPSQTVDTTTQGIDPKTGKPSGALGIFQVVGSTLQGLRDQGKVPAGMDYMTLPGQIQAGVAAMKEKIEYATRIMGKYDPLAAAAYYVDGHAGLNGYLGKGQMPEQTVGYLKKFSKGLGMGTATETQYWGNEPGRPPTPIPPEVTGAAAVQSGGLSMSTSGTTQLPTMPGMPQFGTELAPSLEMLQAIGAAATKSGEESKAAVQAKLEAQTAGAQAAAQREQETLQQALNLQALYGTAPNGSSALIDNLTQAETERRKAMAIKPEIDRLMALDPLSNPVGWFAAQFQLGSLVAQHNSAIQNRNTANREVATQYELQQRAATLTPAITMDTIHKDQIVKVKMAEATAMAESAQVDRQNLGLRSQLLSEKMQWLLQDAQLKQVNYRNAMEVYGLQKEQDLKDEDQAMLDRVNQVRLQYGSPPLTFKGLKALPKDQQESLINANPLASSPGEGIQNLITFGDVHSLQRQPGRAAMADQAGRILELVKPKVEAHMALHQNAKRTEVEKTEINNLYNIWRKELVSGDMTKASPDNPYRINVEHAAKNPALANNKMAQWATETAKAMPTGAVGEREVLAYATAQIKAGRNTDEVAAEVSEFFSKGYEYQFQARGLGTLGFDSRLPSKQREYNIGSNIFGFFERTFGGAPSVNRPIDMMNPNSVKQFLIETQIKKIQEEAGARPLMGQVPGMRDAPTLGGMQ